MAGASASSRPIRTVLPLEVTTSAVSPLTTFLTVTWTASFGTVFGRVNFVCLVVVLFVGLGVTVTVTVGCGLALALGLGVGLGLGLVAAGLGEGVGLGVAMTAANADEAEAATGTARAAVARTASACEGKRTDAPCARVLGDCVGCRGAVS
nr:hypothetical protein GCM10017588_38320 [Microbispora rosea subsp. aerata]